jgi:uncharacterized protein
MDEKQLAQFDRQNYLSLETRRKNGQAVDTPVWFVRDGSRLLINTQAGSGKVKRVRNFPDVRIMPCTVRGEARGEWLPARARLGAAEDAAAADRLLSRKYGLQKSLFQLLGKLTQARYDVIIIE